MFLKVLDGPRQKHATAGELPITLPDEPPSPLRQHKGFNSPRNR